MEFVFNDGGRADSGFNGKAGDCVARSVAIATEQPYDTVYQALALVNQATRSRAKSSGRKSARNGVRVQAAPFRRYMDGIGWEFVPTMKIGSGCRVHLFDGELPMGRLIVSLSKHYTAVIDGVIHDTFDPQRDVHVVEPDTGRPLHEGEWRNADGICRVSRRCVYGYWRRKS